LVSIPCNPEAVITAFKSLEDAEAAQAGEVPGENTQEQDEAAALAAAEVVKAQEEAEASRKTHEMRVRKLLLSL
jgi:hypothetical protein